MMKVTHNDQRNRIIVKRIFGLIVFFLCGLVGPLLIFGPFAQVMQNHWARQLFFWAMTLVGGAALWLWTADDRAHHLLDRWWKCFLASALLETCIYIVVSQLPEISTYPLTMGWSETSRYYNASLFFSHRIYGLSTPPTVLHPSRYLMQAVPFLFLDSPLWLHRTWQVFLWLVTPLLTAIILVRRFLPWKRLETWLLIGVSFVYLTIGPVYYHLLVPVMLIMWGFHTASTQPSSGGWTGRWRILVSMAVLLAASAWAGISRVNWFPVPGMLAAALILMERPLNPPTDQQSELQSGISWRVVGVYISRLAGWVLLGTATALASQTLYIFWSGNEASQFTTSFTSDLLWRRLFPNASYPPGLLLAVFIVSLPVLLVILGKLVHEGSGVAYWRRVYWLRWLGLAGELLVLFVGGTIVSVKIGGGSNLHNLDAYLVLLLVIGVYFYLERIEIDFQALSPAEQPGWIARKLSPRSLVNGGAILMVIVSAFFTVYGRTPPSPLPDRTLVQSDLDQVTKLAQKTSKEGGEVLFLTNRHLLTFGMLDDVRLIPEYERVFLMEAAMSNATDYLGQFYRDLKEQRFALIISEPLSTRYKSPQESFGSENNAWVRRVSQYVLCYYHPLVTLRKVQMQILIPRVNVRKSCPAN
jgi:hypothetical protein